MVICNEVDRIWENCDCVVLILRVGCIIIELVLSDFDGDIWMIVVFNDWVVIDNICVEFILIEVVDDILIEIVDDLIMEVVEDMLIGGVDIKLGCIILVVYII